MDQTKPLLGETDPKPSPDKPIETKPAEGDKPADGAPEKYEAFTLPEGMKLSDEVLGKASDLFKGSNLDQATAQKFVDFHAEQLKSISEAATKTYNDLRDTWRGEVLKDAALAYNGDLRPEVKAAMSKAIDSLGPDLGPKFKEALNLTGVGDNPAFVRGFFQFAQKFTEGTSVKGGNPVPSKPNGGVKQSPAQAMYPNLPSSNG